VIHPVDKGRKRHLLAHMVRDRDMGQVLVFTRTKRGANRLAEQLGQLKAHGSGALEAYIRNLKVDLYAKAERTFLEVRR